MSKQHNRLPHQFDPFRMSEAGSQFTGEIPLSQMRRLAPLLASDLGHVRVGLRFDVDELGVACVQGEIEADLQLVCQRCLEPFAYPLRHTFGLAWVRSEVEIEKLPTRYEPYLVEETPVLLNEVLEEELLLAIPQVPMHPEKFCRVKISTDTKQTVPKNTVKRDNPFAVLADLKKTRKSK